MIKVPIGTQLISDEDRETVLLDLTEPGQRVTFLHGGMGGRGNASYKTSTNRAPRQHQPGEASQEMYVWLRLKLLLVLLLLTMLILIGCLLLVKSVRATRLLNKLLIRLATITQHSYRIKRCKTSVHLSLAYRVVVLLKNMLLHKLRLKKLPLRKILVM